MCVNHLHYLVQLSFSPDFKPLSFYMLQLVSGVGNYVFQRDYNAVNCYIQMCAFKEKHPLCSVSIELSERIYSGLRKQTLDVGV